MAGATNQMQSLAPQIGSKSACTSMSFKTSHGHLSFQERWRKEPTHFKLNVVCKRAVQGVWRLISTRLRVNVDFLGAGHMYKKIGAYSSKGGDSCRLFSSLWKTFSAKGLGSRSKLLL